MSDKTDVLQRRSRWSWYLYDFGNSAYASIILLAVFSSYFKNVIVPTVHLADGTTSNAYGTSLWGISVGIAAVVVALVSPVLGTIADFSRYKKRFLLLFTILSVLFTALLFFAREGDVFTGMLFFILAEIGYRASQVFYDALLADVSTPDTVDDTSGRGWAVGMIGGIVALLIVLVPIQLIGNSVIPYSFLFCALFYLVSSLPAFLWVRERQATGDLSKDKSVIAHAFSNLAKTFRSVRSYKEFIKYTVSFLIYNDGIMMLMDFAAIIGGTLYGLNQTQLIILVVILQITGAVGALLFGRIASRKSGKIAVLISLLILIITISAIFFIPSDIIWFFVVGAFAGFSLSGAQAVSRGLVVQLAPVDKTAEFYGFLSVAGRTSTFIGPFVFGTLTHRMSNWYVNNGYGGDLAEKYGTLWGIGSIIAFLLLGGILLIFVKGLGAGKRIDLSHQSE